MTIRVLVVALAVAFVGVTSSYAIGWSLVNAKIRSEFPEVKRITTSDLAAWLADTGRTPPVLLDVRERAEFDVSHLRNARHVQPSASASAIHLPKDQPIVTYCSVGYRSGGFADKLRQAGYKNVVNLEGSIFRWANEGRPVFNGASHVKKVHPYDRTWGLLLKKKLRAEIP
jgi:rhodanese-related sulfurtransferase